MGRNRHVIKPAAGRTANGLAHLAEIDVAGNFGVDLAKHAHLLRPSGNSAGYPSGFDGSKNLAFLLGYSSAFAEIRHDGFIFCPVFTVKIQINGFFKPEGLHKVLKK